jgi:hypothetical protein
MSKHAHKMRGSTPPQHNALRSRGCPDPDRAVVTRKRGKASPRKARKSTPTAPVLPVGLRVENARRQWEAATAEVRRLKAAGADYSAAVAQARDMRALMLKLDPDMALKPRTVELAQASDANPVKAV